MGNLEYDEDSSNPGENEQSFAEINSMDKLKGPSKRLNTFPCALRGINSNRTQRTNLELANL